MNSDKGTKKCSRPDFRKILKYAEKVNTDLPVHKKSPKICRKLRKKLFSRKLEFQPKIEILVKKFEFSPKIEILVKNGDSNRKLKF